MMIVGHRESGSVNRVDSMGSFYPKIGVFHITEQLVSLTFKWAEIVLCEICTKNNILV